MASGTWLVQQVLSGIFVDFLFLPALFGHFLIFLSFVCLLTCFCLGWSCSLFCFFERGEKTWIGREVGKIWEESSERKT